VISNKCYWSALPKGGDSLYQTWIICQNLEPFSAVLMQRPYPPSALVFCAVTFSTPYLFSHAPLLQSLDAWKSWCQGSRTWLPKHPMTGSILWSNGIWDGHKTFSGYHSISLVSSWAQMDTTIQQRPGRLSQVLPLVSQGHVGQVEQRTKTFLQFGPLIAYLLTANYSYTGIVSLPSLDDMADAIAVSMLVESKDWKHLVYSLTPAAWSWMRG